MPTAHPPTLMDTLEPRALLGVLPVAFSGTDADGDRYTVTLRGGGSMVVTPQTNGGIESIVLSGSTEQSRLNILVSRAGGGDGAVALGALTAPDGGGLRAIFAPSVDLSGAGITLTGGLASLRLRDIVNGADVVTGGDETETSLIFVRFISNTSGESTSLLTFGNRIASFHASSVFFATLSAPSAGSVGITGNPRSNVVGNAAAFSLNLTSPNVERSVDRVNITADLASGAWVLARGAGTIRLGNAESDWNATFGGLVRSLIVSNSLGGTLTAPAFDSIQVRGDTQATFNANDPNNFRVGLRSFRSGTVSNATFNMGDQTIRSIVAQRWSGGGLSADRLDSFRITGGNGQPGTMQNTSFGIFDTLFDNALGNFFVAGTVSGSTVRVLGNTREVSVGGVSSFRFFAGVQESTTAFPTSLLDFNLEGGRVEKFVVRGTFRRDLLGNPITLINNLQLAGRNLVTIDLQPPIRFNNSGTPFGVAADRIGSITFRRDTASTVVQLKNLDLPGSGTPLTTGDFVVRVV